MGGGTFLWTRRKHLGTQKLAVKEEPQKKEDKGGTKGRKRKDQNTAGNDPQASRRPRKWNLGTGDLLSNRRPGGCSRVHIIAVLLQPSVEGGTSAPSRNQEERRPWSLGHQIHRYPGQDVLLRVLEYPEIIVKVKRIQTPPDVSPSSPHTTSAPPIPQSSEKVAAYMPDKEGDRENKERSQGKQREHAGPAVRH
uniref:Uncharacterized protein n=1 Tax=Timema shepardi TaxID=629360 RepID=A0A7R9AR18_TIMSH|nr:unnamed protein product [Timema shepardi]